LVREPAAFLLDEPLSNLDAQLRADMRLELVKLHRQLGTTIVHVTHDQVEAMTMGERICIMKEGRVVYSFFTGVAVYRIWRSGSFDWIKLPAPVALIILVAVFAAEPINGRAIYDLFAAITVFPILVLAAARKEPAGFFIRICEHLGRASYAIYVMQVSVIVWSRTISQYLFGQELTDLGVAGTIVVLVALTALALFLDKYYDQTARARMSRLFRRKQLTSNRNI